MINGILKKMNGEIFREGFFELINVKEGRYKFFVLPYEPALDINELLKTDRFYLRSKDAGVFIIVDGKSFDLGSSEIRGFEFFIQL